MNEGEWYEIHDFKLIYNFRKVKTTTHRYHVVTKVETVIRKLEASLTCNYYVFKDFKNIIRGLSHPKFCIGLLFYIELLFDFLKSARVETYRFLFLSFKSLIWAAVYLNV